MREQGAVRMRTRRLAAGGKGSEGRAGVLRALLVMAAVSGFPSFPAAGSPVAAFEDGVPDPGSSQPQPGQRLGVFFAGTGEPADTFDHVFTEIMAFLRGSGVLVVNDPEDHRPFRMNPSSLEYFRENLEVLRADALLFLHVEVIERKQDRMTLACFDAGGSLAWDEFLEGTLSMAFPKEVERMVRKLKKKLKDHMVEPDLPLRHGKRAPADLS